MKILYLSCHSILEYDEVRLLTELGHEVFSPGAYVEPANPGDASLRPGIPGLIYNPDIVAKLHTIGNQFPGHDPKDHLTPEIIDYFDVVIVMHLPRWIKANWNIMCRKKVIWRTIGQSISSTEAELKPYRDQGMKIIRYSPMEKNIPGYLGSDKLIRFYKDPADYHSWNGEHKQVITFGQSMKSRDRACNFTFFEEVTRPFQRHLFGPGNENVGSWTSGKVSFEQLQQEMRNNRVYFYTGTHPASYTLNFMEAWMTGIPLVAIGPKYGNANYFPGHNLYEVPNLIEHGVNGFISDDIVELQSIIQNLFNDYSLATSISTAGRASAIKHFGKESIKVQWEEFFTQLT